MQNDSIVNPFAGGLCREPDAPVSVSEKLVMTVGRLPYTSGMIPDEREQLPGYDSGVLCMIICLFILLAYNFRHYSTYFKTFPTDLWTVRRTDNSSAVRTFSETGMQTAIVLLACACEGIIINAGMLAEGCSTPLSMFQEILVLTLIAGLYYLWQLLTFRLVGYVFTDRFSAWQWLKGFSASQSLLGMTLVIPALLVLFNPAQAQVVVLTAIVCYVLTRLIFIFKGFRLFYDNFGSLLYFILYLCTLEIVPPVIIYRCIGFLSRLQP